MEALPLLILSSGVYPFAGTTGQIAFFIGVALPLELDRSHINLESTTTLVIPDDVAAGGCLGAGSIMYFRQAPPTEWVVAGVAVAFGRHALPIWLDVFARAVRRAKVDRTLGEY